MAHTTSVTRSAHSVLLFSLGTVLLFALIVVTQTGCGHRESQQEAASLEVSSTSFSGGVIPKRCSCDGQGVSPELSWNAPPQRTQSFALLVTDEDSPVGSYVHWVLYDLPSDKREIPEGFAQQDQPDGSRQGRTGFFVGGMEVFHDKVGYEAPCPPGKSSHHYIFTLYALDTKLNLPPGASQKQVLKAMRGHVLARGELVGRYQR
jgi:Raf kinase inhibitor-like YbhB/YbcL family protein